MGPIFGGHAHAGLPAFAVTEESRAAIATSARDACSQRSCVPAAYHLVACCHAGTGRSASAAIEGSFAVIVTPDGRRPVVPV